jgi:integrase
MGRALTYEQKLQLLKVAGSKPEWQGVRLAQILSLDTTMRGCEIKGLRWRDIDLPSCKLRFGMPRPNRMLASVRFCSTQLR